MTRSTSDATFERDVIRSGIPVFVDFWDAGSLQCRLMAPILEGVGKEAGGRAKLLGLNVKENPATAARFRIRGLPTVALFNNGRIESEFVGIRPAAVLLNALFRLRPRKASADSEKGRYPIAPTGTGTRQTTRSRADVKTGPSLVPPPHHVKE